MTDDRVQDDVFDGRANCRNRPAKPMKPVPRESSFSTHVLDAQNSTQVNPTLASTTVLRSRDPGSVPEHFQNHAPIHANPFELADAIPVVFNGVTRPPVIPLDERHLHLVQCLSRLAHYFPYFGLSTHVDYVEGIVALDYTLHDVDLRNAFSSRDRLSEADVTFCGKIQGSALKRGRLIVPADVVDPEQWLIQQLVAVRESGFDAHPSQINEVIEKDKDSQRGWRRKSTTGTGYTQDLLIGKKIRREDLG